MNFDIAFNLPDWVAGLDLTSEKFARGAEMGGQQAADHICDVKIGLIEANTYARPIRLLKNGSPAWKRLDNWRREQVVERQGQFVWVIRSRGASEKYEERLANLPDGPDGINRTNNAAYDASEMVSDDVIALIQAGISSQL